MKNEAFFRRAQALVLTALRHNGPLKSHVLTELCLRDGLINHSQIGALFAAMSQKHLIRQHGAYKRANGQKDGVIWEAASAPPRLTDVVCV
jgi:hypothetical protein